MNFVTHQELLTDSRALAYRLPRNAVGVLGVPRSGMLPASIIAAELGCHLGDVHTFATSGGTFMRPGRRMNWSVDPHGPVIVVDDSVYGGSALDSAKSALRANPVIEQRYDYQFAAIYTAPGSENKVHWFQRVIEVPRMFAWNWRASDWLGVCLVDMDGVICEDPACKEDDRHNHGECYLSLGYLWPPKRPVAGILTGRLERYRKHTTDWLAVCNVKYGELIMAPFATAQQRRDYKASAWKSEVYAQHPAELLIESNPRGAESIAKRTSKPVFCPTTGEFWCASR